MAARLEPNGPISLRNASSLIFRNSQLEPNGPSFLRNASSSIFPRSILFLKKTNFSTQTRFHPTWAHSFKVPQRRPFSTLAILTQFGKVRAFTDLGHFLLYSNICPNMIRMSNYQNLSYFWLSDDASLFHLQASLSVVEPSALVCLNHAGRVSLLYRWINAFLPNTQVHLDV